MQSKDVYVNASIILLYDTEEWTLKQAQKINIEAFEVRCTSNTVRKRKMRKRKTERTERVTNEEVLWKMEKKCEILNTITNRKLKYLGHIMRRVQDSLPKLVY